MCSGRLTERRTGGRERRKQAKVPWIIRSSRAPVLCQEGFCGSGGDFQNLKPWEMQLLMLFLLGECNCVTVWCEVLLYSEVNQLCVYTRRLSHAQSCPILCDSWTVAHQAPMSMGFPRHEYWSRLPFPSSGNLSDPGIEPRSPISCIGRRSLSPLSHLGSPSPPFGPPPTHPHILPVWVITEHHVYFFYNDFFSLSTLCEICTEVSVEKDLQINP